MRTFHVDPQGKRIIVTDHPSVRHHLLAKGYKMASTARAARQLAMRQGYSVEMANANWS